MGGHVEVANPALGGRGASAGLPGTGALAQVPWPAPTGTVASKEYLLVDTQPVSRGNGTAEKGVGEQNWDRLALVADRRECRPAPAGISHGLLRFYMFRIIARRI